MSKTIIRVSVVDQVMKITEAPVLASGGVNEAVIAFDFCEKWDGFTKTGVFYRDEDEVCNQIIAEDNTCVIPWEVYSEAGYFYFGVFGNKDDIRRTANTLRYKVVNGAASTNLMPPDPTPTVYEQILAELRNSNDAVLRYTEQDLTPEQKAQARENIGVDAMRKISNYVYPLEIVAGKTRNVAGWDQDNEVYSYATTAVEEGSEITITGWQGAYSLGFYAYYFYDESGNCIEHNQATAAGVPITATVTVPAGAVSIAINFRPDQNNVASVIGEHAEEFTPQDILDELEQYDEKIENAVTCEVTLTNFEYPLEITEGKVRHLDGWYLDGASYQYAETTVVAGDKITITGYQPASAQGFYLYYFFDKEGNRVDYYQTTESGVVLTKTVVVPEKAVKLIVNGRPDRVAIKVIGDRTGKYGIDYAVNEINALKNPDVVEVKPKLMTLGDSITALGIGDRGWVGYFIEKTGCELVANVAVIGATLHDKTGTVYDGNPVFQGADNNVNNVLGNQVEKVIRNNYEAPDIIMIAVGTNGALDNPKVNPWDGGVRITKDDISAVYYNADKSLIPLENVDRKTDAGAYRYALEKLHNQYPKAIIFWCTPIHAHQEMRTAEEIVANAESLRIATDYTGQILIDTHRCGINGLNEYNNANGEYLIDGLHPNVNGAKKIGYYNASKVKPFLVNFVNA